MPDFQLIYRGNGAYQTATKLDLQLSERTFEVGEQLAGKLAHKRSVAQNNTFHGMIKFAFDNQRAGPQLPTWEHLKHWALIKAGHCSERWHEVGKLSMREAQIVGKTLAYALRQRVLYVEVAYDPKRGAIVEREAMSVRFTKVMSDEMSELFDKVANILCEHIMPGTSPEALVAMAKESFGPRRAA